MLFSLDCLFSVFKNLHGVLFLALSRTLWLLDLWDVLVAVAAADVAAADVAVADVAAADVAAADVAMDRLKYI